jgi:sugar O-acyltransferase (sialic acid O-acetyltransferase NeuD family)
VTGGGAPRPRLIVIGGGEHARVVMDAIQSRGSYELLGFTDPEPCDETTRRLGVPRLGDEAALASHAGALGVLGFGALATRPRRVEAVEGLTSRLGGWGTVVHATAWVSPSAVIGPGAVILARAVVQTGARIGAHCVVNTGAIVEHDAVLGDHAQLAPGVILGGGARVGRLAYLGLGAVVRDHTAVGAEATVGMGAVVVADVAEGATVLGVPAR